MWRPVQPKPEIIRFINKSDSQAESSFVVLCGRKVFFLLSQPDGRLKKPQIHLVNTHVGNLWINLSGFLVSYCEENKLLQNSEGRLFYLHSRYLKLKAVQ